MKPTRKPGKEGRAKGRTKTASRTRLARTAVTGRGRAEDALKESEEKYKLLIEATHTGYVIIDDQGRVLDANAEYVRLTGHDSLEEIAGREVTEWTAEHDRERNASEVRRCLESGSVRNLVIDYAGPKGGVTPVEINATVLRGTRSPRIFTVCRDITERKRADDAVRGSEERARSIVESIPVGMHLYRLEAGGRLVFTGANRAADRILGVDNSLFIGKTIEEAFPPLTATEVPQRYREVAASGKPWHTERVNYHEGAIHGAYEVHAFQIAPNSMVAAFEEITGRKRTEEALRTSEERWRSLVETSAAWIWETDANLRHTYTNAFVTKCLGYQPAEFLGLDTLSLIHPDDRRLVKEIVQKAATRKEGWSDQVLRWRHKDGSWKYIESSGSALFDERGGFAGLRGVDRDITERRRAEKALKESERFLEAIIESAPT